MSELKLYPRKSALLRGALCGLVSAGFGAMFLIMPDGDAFMRTVGVVLSIVGPWIMVKSLIGIKRPRPSFAANADGFSILGKPARPWSDYNGVKIHTVTVSYIIKIRSLHFKVGSGLKARTKGISWMHMSDKAVDMASQIETFAEAVQLGSVPIVAHDAVTNPTPKTPRIGLVNKATAKKKSAPELDLAAAFRGDNGGPVKSSLTMRERFSSNAKVV